MVSQSVGVVNVPFSPMDVVRGVRAQGVVGGASSGGLLGAGCRGSIGAALPLLLAGALRVCTSALHQR